MKNLTTAEAAKKLKIRPNGIGYLIRKGKIKATKNPLGHYRIPEPELKKYEDAKYELESSEYYTKKDVEILGFSSEILYNGILETIKVSGINASIHQIQDQPKRG